MTDQQNSAFEYVAGSLSKEERLNFEKQMADNQELADEVAFWEEQLMSIQPIEERAPQADTWKNISAAINPHSSESQASEQAPKGFRFDWKSLWQWTSPTVAALVLIFAVIGYNPLQTASPNTDYIAVLTDEKGKARLTALTTGEEKRMWLKWESDYNIAEDTNVQLWAISRRDGQVRPLGVFSSTEVEHMPLDQAAWRLVTDAEFLILTEEEEGGSAIDEPSNIILAKGYCVRFSSTQKES